MIGDEWRSLRRIGGAALIAAGALYVVLVFAVLSSAGLPTTGVVMLARIAEQAVLIRTVMALFVVIDLGWLIALPALYAALAAHDRGWPVVAWVVSGTGALLDMISGLWIFSFPEFSAAYQAAGEQLKPAYLPTGELFFTYVFRVETPFAVAMQCFGALILSAVMLRGAFDRRIAYVGLVTGALGVAGALAGQIPAIFLLIPWLVVTGVALLRSAPAPPTAARG
jgi:hypothetical protein